MSVQTQLAVGNGAAEIKRVKVSNSYVASKEDRMCTVQRHDLCDNVGDGVGVRPAEPLYTSGIGVDRNVLCVVEHNKTVHVRVGCAVKGASVDKEG